MLRIIMLSGYAECGKDTVGAILAAKHGFKRYAFADALKDEAAEIYCLDRTSMDTPEGKRSVVEVYGRTVTLRDVLVRHGGNRRAHNPDIWATKVSCGIRRDYLAGQENFVITDWRYKNEYDRVHEEAEVWKGRVQTWRVRRFDDSLVNDASETALDAFDFDDIIENKGTIQALEDKVARMVRGDVPDNSP